MTKEKLASKLNKLSRQHINEMFSLAIQIFSEEKCICAIYYSIEDADLKVFRISGNNNIRKNGFLLLYKIDEKTIDKALSPMTASITNITDATSSSNSLDLNSNYFNSLITLMARNGEQSYLIMAKQQTPLKYYRLKKKLTVREVALAMHCNIQQIYAWENGRRCPNIDNLKKLSKLYSANLKKLIYEVKVRGNHNV